MQQFDCKLLIHVQKFVNINTVKIVFEYDLWNNFAMPKRKWKVTIDSLGVEFGKAEI